MTSNLAESINLTLVSEHKLPTLDFLEEVRQLFGRWNCDNQKEATYTLTLLMGKFQDILVKNKIKSTRMMVLIILYKYRYFIIVFYCILIFLFVF